jgi:hypothetical protein
MWGSALVISPVLEKGANSRQIYLPTGRILTNRETALLLSLDISTVNSITYWKVLGVNGSIG